MIISIVFNDQTCETLNILIQILFILLYYIFPAIFLFFTNLNFRKKLADNQISTSSIHKRNLLFISIYYGVLFLLLLIYLFPVFKILLLGIFFFFPLLVFLVCFLVSEILLGVYIRKNNFAKYDYLVTKGVLYYYVLPIMALLGTLSFNDCLTPLIFGQYTEIFRAFVSLLVNGLVDLFA